MTHPYYHAQSTARIFGGQPDDYVLVHQWFDVIWTVKPRSILTTTPQNVSSAKT